MENTKRQPNNLTMNLFKFSLLYTAIASAVLILSILLMNYHYSHTFYSNYIFFAIGGSIIISSGVTTIFGYKIHSKKERAWLIILFILIVIIEILIILDIWYPLAGVIGYSATYILITVYWLSAMYYLGFIGKKYKGRFKKENIESQIQ